MADGNSALATEINKILPDDSANTVIVERDGLPDVAIIRADVLEMLKRSHARLLEIEGSGDEEGRDPFDILKDPD